MPKKLENKELEGSNSSSGIKRIKNKIGTRILNRIKGKTEKREKVLSEKERMLKEVLSKELPYVSGDALKDTFWQYINLTKPFPKNITDWFSDVEKTLYVTVPETKGLPFFTTTFSEYTKLLTIVSENLLTDIKLKKKSFIRAKTKADNYGNKLKKKALKEVNYTTYDKEDAASSIREEVEQKYKDYVVNNLRIEFQKHEKIFHKKNTLKDLIVLFFLSNYLKKLGTVAPLHFDTAKLSVAVKISSDKKNPVEMRLKDIITILHSLDISDNISL